MTAPLDFAMLPPEVNSARMYSGPGSGPMLAGAAAWHGLAAELRLTATAYNSVLTELTGQAWHGPSSAAMTAAVAPYVAWLSGTAAQTEETAVQAEAAVAAYEAAFAATVPPPVIAANRAQLIVLVATNFFGQNTPAIAATEADYLRMWAQDATAMYGYAGWSAAASRLTSFTEPARVANPAGTTLAAAAVTEAAATGRSALSELLSSLPDALQGLASPATCLSGANGSAFGNLLNSGVLNSVFASGFYMPGKFLGVGSGFMGLAGKGADAAGEVPGVIAGPVGPAAGALDSPVGGLGALSESAGLGRAGLIGPLSVPPSWATPAPVHSPPSSTLGPAPLAAPAPGVAASTPPVPLAKMAAQGEGRAVPQYGFRLSFVARPPAAG